jgi:FkbM family methyltransferase
LNLNPDLAPKIEVRPYGLSDSEKTISVPYNHTIKSSTRTDLDWDAAPHLQNHPGYEKQDVLLKKASSEIGRLLNDSDCKNFILKVDCEGAETAILRDLLEDDLLEKFSVVLLEWHGENQRSLEKMLSESGFQSISIKPQARPEFGMIYAFNTRTPSSP